jgi:hypothetical protein
MDCSILSRPVEACDLARWRPEGRADSHRQRGALAEAAGVGPWLGARNGASQAGEVSGMNERWTVERTPGSRARAESVTAKKPPPRNGIQDFAQKLTRHDFLTKS